MVILDDPIRFVYLMGALIVCITIHECAHAWSADKLGDPTARRLGRITLNPLKHLDPMGTMMMVVVALAGVGIGWGKPVPVNPLNLRIGARQGMALVALAGPVSNLLLAAVAGRMLVNDLMLFDQIGPFVFQSFIWTVLIVNVSLAAFNMLPIPPLDGFRVLVGILPSQPAYSLAKLEQYGPAILLLVVIFGMQYVGALLTAVVRPLVALLVV